MPSLFEARFVSCLVLSIGACATTAAPEVAAPPKPPPASAAPSTQPPAMPDEPSVRPGINQRYFLPNALEAIGAILEAESREVVEQRDAIVDAIALGPAMEVADIGAGTGLFTNAMAERVGPDGHVFAVDLVPSFLERIRERADNAGLTQVTTVLGHERATTLPERSVDVAFMCDTYHHIEYPQSYMRSLFDTIRPGGQLILIDFERIEGVTSPRVMAHVRAGKPTVIEEVSAAGFVLDAEVDLLEENYFLRFLRP
ncbi:MAG: methyltransferase domain-containing protein [Myxococcota bacterium]